MSDHRTARRVPRSLPLPLIGAILLSVFAPSLALAQGDDDSWRFTITPYVWLPVVNSELSIDDLPVEVESDTEPSEVLDALDFAMLIGGEVRKGKVGLVYDIQYLKLGNDGTTTGPAQRDADAEITIADATLALEYRLVEQPKVTLDILAGARGVYAETELDVDAGIVLPALSGDQNQSWIDPIVGAKCSYRMGEKWALNGYADIGGFGVGSELTYQLMGAVSYSFNEHIALQGGYRAFFVDFEDGDYKLDVMMHGPIIGLTFSF